MADEEQTTSSNLNAVAGSPARAAIDTTSREQAVRFVCTKASGDEIQFSAVPTSLHAIQAAAAKELSEQRLDPNKGSLRTPPMPPCLIRFLDLETAEPITEVSQIPASREMRVLVAGPDLYGVREGVIDTAVLKALPASEKPGWWYYTEGVDAIVFLLGLLIVDWDGPTVDPLRPSFDYDAEAPNDDEWHQVRAEVDENGNPPPLTPFNRSLDAVLHNQIRHVDRERQVFFCYDAFHAMFTTTIWDRITPAMSVFKDNKAWEGLDVDPIFKRGVSAFWQSFYYVRILCRSLLKEPSARAEFGPSIRCEILGNADEKYGRGRSSWYCRKHPTRGLAHNLPKEPACGFLMAADLIEAVPIDLWLLDDVGLLREIAAAAERARNEAVETIEAEFVDGDNEDEEYDETLQEYTRGYNVPYRIMNVIADIQALKLQQAQVGGAPAQEQATDDVDVVLADRLSSGVVDPVGPEV